MVEAIGKQRWLAMVATLTSTHLRYIATLESSQRSQMTFKNGGHRQRRGVEPVGLWGTALSYNLHKIAFFTFRKWYKRYHFPPVHNLKAL